MVESLSVRRFLLFLLSASLFACTPIFEPPIGESNSTSGWTSGSTSGTGGGDKGLCTDPSDRIEFGGVPLGADSTLLITLSNCDEASFSLEAAGLETSAPAGVFELIGLPSELSNGDGISLAPGEDVSFSLRFTPAEVAGYSAELQVRGDREIDLPITGAGGGMIRIELTWHTPLDPDETDGLGSNLDLHYLRPGGTWNTSPDDCYSQNRNPDWGTVGVSDDPGLVVEDSDGAGPELLVHLTPSETGTYRVGAYYFNSNEFGLIRPSALIWVQGAAPYSVTGPDMVLSDPFGGGRGHFWHIADITWRGADGSITAGTGLQTGFGP